MAAPSTLEVDARSSSSCTAARWTLTCSDFSCLTSTEVLVWLAVAPGSRRRWAVLFGNSTGPSAGRPSTAGIRSRIICQRVQKLL